MRNGDRLNLEIMARRDDLPNGIDYQYCEDDKYTTIKIDHIDLDGRPLALLVSWYKSKGSTQPMLYCELNYGVRL